MLKTRIVTAVISLVALGVVLFVVPADVAELVIAVVVLAGAWEWSGFLGLSGSSLRWVFVTVIAGLVAVSYTFLPDSSDPILRIAFVWWFAAFLWTLFFPTPIPAFDSLGGRNTRACTDVRGTH